MNKTLTIIPIIIVVCFVGGVYGILHDQLTYTISPEYYTKFKFYQFGLVNQGDEAFFPNPRIQVSIVGFLATWWMGLPIGLVLGVVGMLHRDSKEMFKHTIKASLVTIIVAFITGIIGLFYGKFYLANIGVNWWIPENVLDTKNFISVGSMHNFSYFGGITGLIAGCIYSSKQKRKYTSR